MVVDPMLATSGPLPEDEERWSFEPKWDGLRAVVRTDGKRLRVLTRRGTDLAGRLPELHPLAGTLPPGTVLDGELVVLDEDGRVDFDGMRRRWFDVLGVAPTPEEHFALVLGIRPSWGHRGG